MTENYVLGIDLGGTNIKIGCFDRALKLIGKISVPTGADMDAQYIVEQFYTASTELLKQNNLTMDDIAAVGVGAPGIVNPETGVILAAPNFPKFKDVHLQDMVAKRFNKPAKLENDANTACWAEHVVGAAKGSGHMVMFTLGTGVGGGIVTDGLLVHGPTGGAAELGHIIVYPNGRLCGCGQRGCVEAYASASSTAVRATEIIEKGSESSLTEIYKKNGRITCKDIFAHAVKGDAVANEIVEGTAEALAFICVQMANITEPKHIVFAGGMIAAGDFLLDRIHHYYNQQIGSLYQKGSLNICFATLGEDAGIIGASSLALAACEK